MDKMEMPTPCQHCGEVFDLNDGACSEKWYFNVTICANCREEEKAEVEKDELIDVANNELSDAFHTFEENNLWSEVSLENLNVIVKNIHL